MPSDRAIFPGHKAGNQYAELLGSLYNQMPKAVLAAIAVSYAIRIHEDDMEAARAEVLEEWGILYRAGIVPQRPPADVR